MALACGGSTDGGGSGGSAGTGAVGSGGVGGTGGGGTGGLDCSAYHDMPPAQGVTVRFENARTEAIFVTSADTCGATFPFELHDSANQKVRILAGGCGFTCEDLQTFSGGCPAVCLIPPLHRLEPGGSFELAWGGAVYQDVSMPSACWFEDVGSGAQCAQAVPPAQGSYTFTAAAGTDCATCTCQPDANGHCEVSDPSSQVGGQTLTATAAANLPGGASVKLVFQ